MQVPAPSPDPSQRYPIHVAAELGDAGMVEMLIQEPWGKRHTFWDNRVRCAGCVM